MGWGRWRKKRERERERERERLEKGKRRWRAADLGAFGHSPRFGEKRLVFRLVLPLPLRHGRGAVPRGLLACLVLVEKRV